MYRPLGTSVKISYEGRKVLGTDECLYHHYHRIIISKTCFEDTWTKQGTKVFLVAPLLEYCGSIHES